MADEAIKLNLDEVPNIERCFFSYGLPEEIKKFYEDPKNMRRYKEWRKERRRRSE